MSELPYLVTKVTVPPVRASMVSRASLTSRLDTHVPLILLAAGAGFGKTTSLAAWARETHCQVAWLTLDEQDNDSTRFWDYVLLALQTSIPALEGAVARLRAVPPPAFLASLLNEVALHAVEVALVLDDYHLIDAPAIHQSLAFWLAHAPACLHLILATRVEPELSLSRLRARGHLVEIREADLRLNAREAGRFLTQTMDLHLREADVLQLFQRTEGWIAGLQLAALSLRTTPDPSAWVSQFRGSHHILLDYIQEEILEREPLSVQRFLLRTSVLTRMTAALCQQLCGEEADQPMLEALARANLFVVPLDDERYWYRSHPLFREALLARLQAVEPDQVPLLHRRASVWYAEQRLLSEAIPHALASHDFAWATNLIEKSVVPQSWRNNYHTLRRWLSSLPEEILSTHPNVSLLYAQAIVLTTPGGPGTLPLAEPLLNVALHSYQAASNETGVGSVQTLRAVLLFLQGDVADAFALARTAAALLPLEDHQWRGFSLSLLGTEAVLAGALAAAAPLLQQALVIHEQSGMLTGKQFTLAMRAELALAVGDWGRAARAFGQVLSIEADQSDLTRALLTLETGVSRNHFERLAWYGLACLSFERNQLTEAHQYLQNALAEGQFLFIPLLTPGLLLQVRMLVAQGLTEQAQIVLGELAARASQPEVDREIQMARAWVALACGDLTTAKQWAEGLAEARAPQVLARREEETLLLARLSLAENQPERALDLLEPLLQDARAQGQGYREQQILVQQASAFAASGAHTQARQTLLQALTRAMHEGAVRLFLEEGQPMETWLNTLLPDLQDDTLAAFVLTILEAFTKDSVSPEATSASAALPHVSPLTPQEQRVLRLLAEGVSNQDIAQRLVISLATARKHVSNILGKLGARSRTQAVARARMNALL
jgi:LuxR family transcriptional regulator, maltose regulon positive regulatory protein